jgi:site-specific recombinase XerD
MSKTLTQLFEDAMVERSCLPNTRSTYHVWVKRFYRFCRKPASEWQPNDVREWMLQLHHERFAATSRKQALCAVKFVFDHVLKRELGWLDLPPNPIVRQTLRTIPTREEIGRIFAGLRGQVKIMAAVMYGAGLRVNECCHLRVKDVNVGSLTIDVWSGKGDKCRRTVLPRLLVAPLQRHIAWRKSVHDLDLQNGCGLVELPGRLAVKYKTANRDFHWQWLFPSNVVRGQYRWHATDEMVAKQMRHAVRAAGITKRVTPHTLRHGFVTHALEAGNDLAVVQKLVGHEDVNTTMIYAHGDRARGFSPLDVGPVPTPSMVASPFGERLLSE